MRVLLVHNYYQQPGGEDAVVANESALLAEHGHEVIQYSVDNHSISGIAEKTRVFLDLPYSRRARDTFARQLNDVRPDVVHVHNFFPLLTTSIYDACQAAGVPIVQTLHNFRIMCAGALLLRDGKLCEKCLDGNAYWGVLHRCYRNSAVGSLAVARMIDANRRRGTWRSKVDCFVALSESAKWRYVRAGVPTEHIVVKPNFAPDPGEPVFEGRHGALYVGRLSPEKGVRELISAWQRVDYPLRIVGDGPLGPELRSCASANVTFLGWLTSDEVGREMATAAMLVVPSTWLEGCPVVLAEAFAAGLPAVVSNIGVLKEVVRHGDTGLHVPTGNAAALAQAVNSLRVDPRALEAFGRAARRAYLAHYSPTVNYARLLATYDRVCGADGSREAATWPRDSVYSVGDTAKQGPAPHAGFGGRRDMR